MKVNQVIFREGVRVDGKAAVVLYYSAMDGVDMTVVSQPAGVRIQTIERDREGKVIKTFRPTIVPFSNVKHFEPIEEPSQPQGKGK